MLLHIILIKKMLLYAFTYKYIIIKVYKKIDEKGLREKK